MSNMFLKLILTHFKLMYLSIKFGVAELVYFIFGSTILGAFFSSSWSIDFFIPNFFCQSLFSAALTDWDKCSPEILRPQILVGTLDPADSGGCYSKKVLRNLPFLLFAI